MERAEILNIFIKHLRSKTSIPKGTQVDPSVSMKELGVKSLDALQCAYGIMRELEIQLPVEKIAEAKSINELVDLFIQTKSSRES